jgi:ferritin-like metal-binding protein YciE
LLGTSNFENLEQLYVDELEDAYDFEHQILDALPKMEEAANAAELKQAFREHRRETEGQVGRLEQVFRSLGREAGRKTCKGMKGLIAEGEEYVKAKGDEATLDAALISAAQRVEHYEIAVYGTLRTYADALGYADQARLLDENLEEESAADEKLTELATSGINVEARAAAAT